MKNKLFKITNLPDLSNNVVQTDTDRKFREMCLNYEYLIKDTLSILRFLLTTEIKKPLLIYNLLFLVELSLKFYLIKYSKITLEEIENKGHDIVELIRLSNSINPKFTGLGELLNVFKDKNNNCLNFKNYYDYKYNHKKGKEILILDFDIDENEKDNVKEVIEWIKYHMQIL